MKESEIPQLGETIESLATEFEMPPQVEKNLLTIDEAKRVKV